MTVGVVLRVPGEGAVIATDGRFADPETGAIYSDTDQKWGEFGSVVACYAGEGGPWWLNLRAVPPLTWRAFEKRISRAKAEFEILVYDRKRDRIWHTDHKGDALQVGNHATIGCGGPIALGLLDGARAPQSLDAAAKLARRAVAIACRRNVFCGGRIRTVVVPRRGNVSIR